MTLAQAIEWWMTQASESMFDKVPKWVNYISFFNDDVQDVLLERHPEKIPFDDDAQKSYPIDAWKAADQAALHLQVGCVNIGEFTRFLVADPVWSARLFAAVVSARWHEMQSASNPQTAGEKREAWRARRLPWEIGIAVGPVGEAGVPKDGPFITLEEFRKAVKDPVQIESEPLDPPTWHDAAAEIYPRTYRGGHNALKQSLNKENKRREMIMRKWAECWVMSLRVPLDVPSIEKSKARYRKPKKE